MFALTAFWSTVVSEASRLVSSPVFRSSKKAISCVLKPREEIGAEPGHDPLAGHREERVAEREEPRLHRREARSWSAS